jgi:hypothetical protein
MPRRRTALRNSPLLSSAGILPPSCRARPNELRLRAQIRGVAHHRKKHQPSPFPFSQPAESLLSDPPVGVESEPSRLRRETVLRTHMYRLTAERDKQLGRLAFCADMPEGFAAGIRQVLAGIDQETDDVLAGLRAIEGARESEREQAAAKQADEESALSLLESGGRMERRSFTGGAAGRTTEGGRPERRAQTNRRAADGTNSGADVEHRRQQPRAGSSRGWASPRWSASNPPVPEACLPCSRRKQPVTWHRCVPGVCSLNCVEKLVQSSGGGAARTRRGPHRAHPGRDLYPKRGQRGRKGRTAHPARDPATGERVVPQPRGGGFRLLGRKQKGEQLVWERHARPAKWVRGHVHFGPFGCVTRQLLLPDKMERFCPNPGTLAYGRAYHKARQEEQDDWRRRKQEYEARKGEPFPVRPPSRQRPDVFWDR